MKLSGPIGEGFTDSTHTFSTCRTASIRHAAILNTIQSREKFFSLIGNKTDAVFTGSRDAVVLGNVSTRGYGRKTTLIFGRELMLGLNFWSDR